MEQKNDLNGIIFIKIFAGRNDVENEKNAIFYDEMDTLMHVFEVHS